MSFHFLFFFVLFSISLFFLLQKFPSPKCFSKKAMGNIHYFSRATHWFLFILVKISLYIQNLHAHLWPTFLKIGVYARPGKRDQCSWDPENGFLNIPQFCLHNSINIFIIMHRNVLKRANKEQLGMIWILRFNVPASKSICFDKCSSGSRIPDFSRSGLCDNMLMLKISVQLTKS